MVSEILNLSLTCPPTAPGYPPCIPIVKLFLPSVDKVIVLFIAPPLCITKSELLQALSIISESISESIED